jgi:hypothetical protein
MQCNFFFGFPATGLNKPLGIRKVKASGFFMIFGTVKMVRSSPLRTGRLYPQEYPGTHF